MASNFVIDVNTVNNETIKSNLEAFIASRPDATKWAQFFASSSGQITVELISAFASFLKFDSISSRRENFLAHAQTRAGVVAGGQQLGYAANRGRNALIDITFTPAVTTTLPKWHVLGNVNGISLVLLNSTVVNAGVPITVSTVVGDILEETITATTDGSATFRFTQKRVSEDVQIFIGTSVIPHSNNILDLLIDDFFLQTNVLGSVDAKFLNQLSAPTRYINGSIIKLQWIELKDFVFTASNVALDISEGVLTNTVITTLFQDPETNESIKLNAPLENETKFTIRGRNDAGKLLLLADPNFIAAGGRDTAVAAVVEIFAIKNDLSILDSTQRQALLDSIKKNRPFGVQPPIIIDPVTVFLDVDVTLVLETNITGDPNSVVRSILASSEKKLSTPEQVQSIDFIEVEKSMTASDLIKISRILIKFTTWSGSEVIRRGIYKEPTTPDGFIYEALEFLRFSGSSEPTWPAPIPQTPPLTGFIFGQTVTDGQIKWVSIAQDNTLTPWAPNTVFKVGDKVKHLGVIGNDPTASFQVLEILSKSGLSSIAVSASALDQGTTFTAVIAGIIGNGISLVFDGVDDLDTVVNAWNLSNPSNTVGFTGNLGTFVPTAITVNLTGGLDAINAEPNWPIPVSTLVPDSQSFTDDNQILWLMIAKSGTPPVWTTDTTYKTGDVVIPTTIQTGQENIMFQMVGINGKTGLTEPVFPAVFAQTVIDNEVLWITRNKLNSPQPPKDNEYYLITETITAS